MIVPLLEGDIREVSPSVFAYIGDAVFELYVRQYAAARKAAKSGALHKLVVKHVRAQAQAEAARVLLPELSEAEADVFRRGKNSNPGSLAKNASPTDYKYATGLEAVIGFLYLTDQEHRLDLILNRIIEIQTVIEKGEDYAHRS
jgi:ribonuclease-3 family protein